MSTNTSIADIFDSMADILEIQNVQWKPQAYRTAAREIKNLHTDVREIYTKGWLQALENLPGIGKNTALKIEQYVLTGRIKQYDELASSVPPWLLTIMDVPGMWPKKAASLYKELHIDSLEDLKKAVEEHKISTIPGFGEVSEKHIAESLGMRKTHIDRLPYTVVLPLADSIVKQLESLVGVEKVVVCGSLRRKEDTIGDIDILVLSKKPQLVMDAFVELPEVQHILAHGPKKSAVILHNGMQADLRVVDKKSFGAAMQYFTGNKAHNIALRKIAIKQWYKLNEYGLFKGDEIVAGQDEEDIYHTLGLPYIAPEERKGTGEI